MPLSICDHCGVTLQVGDYPFCPHGRSASAVIADDVPGGFWAHNGFAELAAEGFEIRAKWAGPNDAHLTRWDSVDLEGTADFLRRHADDRRRVTKTPIEPPIPITVTEGERFRAEDLT